MKSGVRRLESGVKIKTTTPQQVHPFFTFHFSLFTSIMNLFPEKQPMRRHPSGTIAWKKLILLLAILLIINGVILLWKLSRPAPTVPEADVPSFSTQIRIQIMNECGDEKIAQKMTDHLRACGMDVVEVRNAQSFDFSETVVIDRIDDQDRAKAVSKALGLNPAKVVRQLNSQEMVDVTVIIGKDYGQLKFPSPHKK
jgi:hypothetical protein